MGWYDDFGAGTNATKISNVGAGVNTFYDKKFLETVKNTLRLIPFGQRRPLPMGEGKTIEFFRWLNIAASVSGALLTEGLNPDATQIKGQKLTAVLKEYGAFAQLTSLLKQTHIDRNVEGAAELFGEHAGTIIDLITKYQMSSNGAYPLAADLAAASTFSNIVDSATSTTLVDAELNANSAYGDANDDLNQSIVIITSGTGYGQARIVTDFVTSGGTMTISPAWDINPVAGDTYVVTTPDEITAGDDLDYANVKKARTILATYKAQRFPGGYYIGIVSPDMISGLMEDTDWKNVHTYKDQTNGIFDAEIGKFAGVRFIEDTNPFAFPVAGRGTSGTASGPGADGANYSATGAVGSALILGKNAFGVTTMKNKMGQIPRAPIIVKTSGPSDTSNPLNRYGTVGWALEFVAKSLNPLFAVSIWCDVS